MAYKQALFLTLKASKSKDKTWKTGSGQHQLPTSYLVSLQLARADESLGLFLPMRYKPPLPNYLINAHLQTLPLWELVSTYKF